MAITPFGGASKAGLALSIKGSRFALLFCQATGFLVIVHIFTEARPQELRCCCAERTSAGHFSRDRLISDRYSLVTCCAAI
jgi:hypothetical protein